MTKQAQAFNDHWEWWANANGVDFVSPAMRDLLRACAASAWGAGIEWDRQEFE